MERRRFLELSIVGSTALGGCALRAPTAGAGAPGANAPDPPLGRTGVPPSICSEEAHDDPGIYAITQPAFAENWGGQSISPEYRPAEERGLAPNQTVIGIEMAGVVRAYPVSVLWDHEIVNDTLGSTPVLVTYCPLCRSGMVAERRVNGRPTVFRVSGLLWKPSRLRERAAADRGRVFGTQVTGGETVSLRRAGNLVMIDAATGTFWSQLLARGICGPMEGEALAQVPSTVTTWEAWQLRHPDTRVLLPPPYSRTTAPESAADGRLRSGPTD